jgi:glycosyltransferase involved in cell wall biosynthesis
LIDYRPALRERSGVGEYVFQIARALLAGSTEEAAQPGLDLTLFSSSWKDRVVPDPALQAAAIVDCRVPVGVLNLLWHRVGWPPAELLARRTFDVVHSPHPLLMPSRSAARVVTIHDLYFLKHPEQSRAEVRRDYAALARAHAGLADQIIVPSQFTASEVQTQLGVSGERITICPHGRPGWPPRTKAPAGGYILFMGTLEPRKNVEGLLDAYERLLAHRQAERAPTASAAEGGGRDALPLLVLAGSAVEASTPWLERIGKPPLSGFVRHIGYVDPGRRRDLYEGARLVVQPSFEEGFGLPVLEAMTVGVPVVAARRGALPEVLGDAGLLVDPGDPDDIAAAMDRLIRNEEVAAACAERGKSRARRFDWAEAARGVHRAYERAIERRQCGSA